VNNYKILYKNNNPIIVVENVFQKRTGDTFFIKKIYSLFSIVILIMNRIQRGQRLHEPFLKAELYNGELFLDKLSKRFIKYNNDFKKSVLKESKKFNHDQQLEKS
jgi:hypothetical protein